MNNPSIITTPGKPADVRAWLDARELVAGRCIAHPAYDADNCPICGTSATIGVNR